MYLYMCVGDTIHELYVFVVSLQTFPELFQHVHECIKLLESVYMIPVGGVNHEVHCIVHSHVYMYMHNVVCTTGMII